ncbi:MAG: hypothetical protein Q9M26_08945 [Mariprofundales bacterium]|nr:hypothetical protein [Mariprofundales bacterium]
MKTPPFTRLAAIALLFPLVTSIQTATASEPLTTIPAILDSMEGHAEDIVDTLLAKNATASHQLYDQLGQEMQQLRQRVTSDPADERRSRELMMAYSWMRVIDIEITDKSWLEAAVGANQLTGMIIQTSHFPTLMQRDVAWLDYLGREIELLTMEDPKANADLLAVRQITLDHTWNRISRDLIKDFRNKPLVERGNSLLMKIEHAKKPARTIALAKKLLDFVDQVEKRE